MRIANQGRSFQQLAIPNQLNTEGFSLHPRTFLVDSPAEADIVVWVSTRGKMESEIPPSDYRNVVLLDYADGCGLHESRGKVKHLVGHFKRSFVKRTDGVFQGNCTDDRTVLPLAYSGKQTFVNKEVSRERKYAITNMLRDDDMFSNTRRRMIVDYTRSFVQKHNLTGSSYIGNHGSGGPFFGFDKNYLDVLADSKIIVTANPAPWEGESMRDFVSIQRNNQLSGFAGH